MTKKKKKNLVLFIGNTSLSYNKGLRDYNKKAADKLKIAIIRDLHSPREARPDFDYIVCDLSKPLRIAKALEPYQERLLAVVCSLDKHMADFVKVIPFVPYLRAPTEKSLQWLMDKVAMRQHFANYDKKITPNFLIVRNNSQASVKEIEQKLKFPLLIKPASLGASLWVINCFHKEELASSLRKVFKRVKAAYKKDKRAEEPRILVEEFMEGPLYSVDAYVNSRGGVAFCPMVQVKTGKEIGFDDFFGYQQMTPATLKRQSVEAAQAVAVKAVHALQLRSSTAHIELIKTEDGFKVVEVGPRLGGFRQDLYELSYGINHALNDIWLRIPKKTQIPRKVKGHSAAMKFFAKEEGRLHKLFGLKKIKKLKSFVRMTVNKKKGEMCRYAKNGGRSVCNLIMFNKSRSNLLADIRRAESCLQIITKPRRNHNGNK